MTSVQDKSIHSNVLYEHIALALCSVCEYWRNEKIPIERSEEKSAVAITYRRTDLQDALVSFIVPE